MSALFYDGPSVSFDKKSDNIIEKITTEYFVEYISQDLSQENNDKTQWSVSGQGLLDSGNEKYGVERLHEALQCCMWSNMRKVTM